MALNVRMPFTQIALVVGLTVPLIAQAKAEAMSCEELLRIRDDRRRWDQIIQSVASTDTGWQFRLRKLAAIDGNDKETSGATVTSLEAEAAVGHAIGAMIVPQNSVVAFSGPIPMPFFARWTSLKPIMFSGRVNRCGDERARTATNEKDETFTLTFTSPDEIDNVYTLIGYDDRKNVLFTAEFVVRPRAARSVASAPAQSKSQPSDEEKNAAVVRAAYQASSALDRCSEYHIGGNSRAEVRDRLVRIEKSAKAMNMDLRSIRERAERDAKSSLEVFDMIGLMGSLNYQQRSSLQQFCSLQGLELLAASKHFAELDRAAGR